MWKIHRYYLKEVTANSVLTFLVLFGIVLVATVYRGIDRAQGGDLIAALLITFFWAADTFPHLLAMSLLIASVLTFARASQEREITAIRAAGISPRVPMVAALLIGLAFSIFGSYTQHYLIPWAHYHKYRVVGEAMRNFILNTGMSGHRIAHGGFFMVWRRKDEDGVFHDVVVKLARSSEDDDRDGFAPGEAIHAETARIEFDNVETISLVLEHVRAANGSYAPRGIRASINIRAISERDRRTESDKDLTSDQLLSEVYRGVHPEPEGARFTVHRRACFALMPCLFAPIGFCIGVLARDRGRMTALLIAMVPLLLFYGCVLVAPQLMRTLEWPPIAWLPAAVVGGLGVPFCWKLLRI